MTPTELINAAKLRFNSVGDDFFPNEMMYELITAASGELARKAYVIERTYTTSTVASQQEYSLPTNAFSVKRVTYDGRKLQPINFREDDVLTSFSSQTTATGDPQYYAFFNRTLYLRPVPASVATLKIFSYNFPQAVTTTSTLEVPTEYHHDLLLYLVSEMASKENNFEKARHYRELWDSRVLEIKKEQRKRVRGDSFSGIQDVDAMGETILGMV